MGELYLGLISGTSMDGIDAAIATFTETSGERRCDLIATSCYPYTDGLRQALEYAVAQPAACDIDTIGRLDTQVGEAFAAAAVRLIEDAGLETARIRAIGSHGQTVRHRPDDETPFTLQIGDPNVIAARTCITTVGDFRRRDIVLGGQGAPLAPAFHGWLFARSASRAAVVNIGGISNVTLLEEDVRLGFDSGPGNTLMDRWIHRHRGQDFDQDAAFARQGDVDEQLLKACLDDPYFDIAPPKSTGREYFNLEWLETRLESLPVQPAPADVQATLLELTVITIARALERYAPGCERIMICGGGSHNQLLMDRLAESCAPGRVSSTASAGLEPDWVEAAAFAWLARETLAGRPGNRPAVTGARAGAILGGIYLADEAAISLG